MTTARTDLVYISIFRAAFELGHHEGFALLEILHVPGFCFWRNNSGRNGQQEGFPARQCFIWWSARRANSRRLTDGSDHYRRILNVAWQSFDCSLVLSCSFSYAESFVIFLRNKACVGLKKIIRQSSIWNIRMNAIFERSKRKRILHENTARTSRRTKSELLP